MARIDTAPSGGSAAREDGIEATATTLRAPAGHLMCLAQFGTLTMVARIDPASCGSPQGCNGAWPCMTGRN